MAPSFTTQCTSLLESNIRSSHCVFLGIARSTSSEDNYKGQSLQTADLELLTKSSGFHIPIGKVPSESHTIS